MTISDVRDRARAIAERAAERYDEINCTSSDDIATAGELLSLCDDVCALAKLVAALADKIEAQP